MKKKDNNRDSDTCSAAILHRRSSADGRPASTMLVAQRQRLL